MVGGPVLCTDKDLLDLPDPSPRVLFYLSEEVQPPFHLFQAPQHVFQLFPTNPLPLHFLLAVLQKLDRLLHTGREAP